MDASKILSIRYIELTLGILLFSLGFAFGALIINQNCVRRKFRVILALYYLIYELRTCDGDYMQIPSELLKLAGDNRTMPRAIGRP